MAERVARGGAGEGAAGGGGARRKQKVYSPLESIQSSRTTGALSGSYHAYGVCGSKKEGYGRYLNDYWRENCDSTDPEKLREGHSMFLKMLKRCIRLRSRAANTLLEQARMDLLRDLISGHHDQLSWWQIFTFKIKQKWESGPRDDRQLHWVELEMEDGHGFRVVFSDATKPEKEWPDRGIGFIRAPGGEEDIYDSVNGLDLNDLVEFELKITLEESEGYLNPQVLRDLGHLRHLNMWKRLYLIVKYTDPLHIEGFRQINTRRKGWAGKNWEAMIYSALENIRENKGSLTHLWEIHQILQAYMNEDGVAMDIEVEKREWVVETVSTIAFPYYSVGGAGGGGVGAGGGRAVPESRRIVLEPFDPMYNRDQAYDTVKRHFGYDDERRACTLVYQRFDDIQDEYSGPIGLPGSISGEQFLDGLDDNANARSLPFLLRSFTLQMNLFDDITWKQMYSRRGEYAFDMNELHSETPNPSFPCARIENLKQSEPIEYNSRVRLSQCSSYMKLLSCCISMLRNVRDFAFALVTSPKFKVNDSFAKPALTRPCDYRDRSIQQILSCLINTQEVAQKKKGTAEIRMRWNIPRESFHPFDVPGSAGMADESVKASDIIDRIRLISWDMTYMMKDDDEIEKEKKLRKALDAFDPIKGKERKTEEEDKIQARATLAAKELGLTLNGAIQEYESDRERGPTEWSIHDVINRYNHLDEDCKIAHELELNRLNVALDRLKDDVNLLHRGRRQRHVRELQFPPTLDYDNSSLQAFFLHFYQNSVLDNTAGNSSGAGGGGGGGGGAGGKKSAKQKQKEEEDIEAILREHREQTGNTKKGKKGGKQTSTEGSAAAGGEGAAEYPVARSDSVGLSAPFAASLVIGQRDLTTVRHGFHSLSNLFVRVSLADREDIDEAIRLLKH